jgi:hypothetical protein
LLKHDTQMELFGPEDNGLFAHKSIQRDRIFPMQSDFARGHT